MVCTFFGHKDCFDLDANILKNAIEELIHKGVNTFYVGHQGHFDGMVLGCLAELKKTYPNISFAVVLAYLPTQKPEYDLYSECSMYPEGQENGHPKFAISRRNKWLIDRADYCVTYITHTWGGAYKFAQRAKKKGRTMVNLGSIELK